ncbi:PIR protein [Plasmodium ovale]|uniref:PIR protein n=1 Tax=Plasmodium ovale TaxID=36330 RepID=A0A1C3KGS6_PLAOA|nr:PIR protein [Plasmodium ovale]
MRDFTENNLASNKYKTKLDSSANINELENLCTKNPSNYGDIENLLSKINSNVYATYSSIKRDCISEINNSKCCREVNYYLDLINSFINSANIIKNEKELLVEIVEGYWKDYIDKFSNYTCKREQDIYSVEKRSVLKQVCDLYDDKTYFELNSSKYNKFLTKKWDKILNYSNNENKELYFKINFKTINKSGKYKELLLDPKEIIDVHCKNIDITHISISPEEPGKSSNLLNGDLQSLGAHGSDHHYQEDSKGAVDPEISYTPWMSIFTPLSGSISAILIFSFLYKFSPLGSFIKLYKRNPNRISKNMKKEQTTELLQSEENISHYISYDSMSY